MRTRQTFSYEKGINGSLTVKLISIYETVIDRLMVCRAGSMWALGEFAPFEKVYRDRYVNKKRAIAAAKRHLRVRDAARRLGAEPAA